jgi:hypothetical protein
MKNCRSRKMLKAPPRNGGTVNGSIVPIHPSHLKIIKLGIIVTCAGRIMVATNE